MKLRQVELYDANCEARLMCWLPVDKRLKVGVRVTLKEIPKRDWIVTRMFTTEIEDAAMNRKWRVGGLFVLLFLLTYPLHAQEPVNSWADWASYGTAAINPTMAAVDAWRSPDRGCKFARLALSEGIANGVGITLKHFIVSPRPCLGCPADGMPSGHTWNSVIGFSTSWKWGTAAALTTAQLRTDAHRHTPWQVLAGAGLGVLAEGLGHAILRCEDAP